MKKGLGIVLAVLLVAAFSIPAMGATLSVSGKYVGKIAYDGGYIYSVNPGDDNYPGVDLLRLSTLYLNIDFAEGELMSAHIPLRLYKAIELEVDQNPDDNYLFVFKGAPLTLSLTDAESGDYFFASFGDPLGLVKYLNTSDHDYATFKAAGQPFGLGFTSYFIATDPIYDSLSNPNATYPRYALGRVTYGLSSGHTVGAIYAAREDPDKSVVVNVEGDVTGPLPISEGATFTAALALSKTESSGVWSNPVNAYEVNVGGVKVGNFTLSGNVRAVDPAFDLGIVAPDKSDTSPSDAWTYKGKRQVQGEAVTNVNIAGQAVKLTLGDDYRINYDGSIGTGSTNKIYGSGEFSPSAPVTVTVGGYYQDYLATTGDIKDDYRKNVYGKVAYVPAENLTINGGAQWMGANLGTAEGSGFKLDGSAEVKPAAGVLVKGNAAYESGEYNFIDGSATLGANHTRLDAEAYAEAKQSFVPAGIKQVDTILAGLARGIQLSSSDVQTTYVGYAEANIAINELFSDKIAVLSGKSTETGYADHYGTIVHNKFTYALSSNSTFGLGYTHKGTEGTWDAAYTVKLGDNTIVLSYGASGLGDACINDFDDGKPWAWLCTANIAPNPDFYKLTVTVPF